MLYKQKGSKNFYVKLKSGGKVYARSTGTANRRRAEAVERQLRTELWRLKQNISEHTFDSAGARWLRENEHKRSLATDLMILEWLAPRIGHLLLSEITRDTVDTLRQELRQDHAESSVNRYMALLRAILNRANKQWEWIEKTPHIPMYPTKMREPRFLTWQQFLSLQRELPTHLQAPAWFAVTTGLRAAAIQSLRWRWIDRSGVTIPADVQKNGLLLKIPLHPVAWYVLAEQYKETSGLLVGSRAISGNERVFVNHAKEPWRGKFTTRAWKKAAAAAGVPDATFHDLRHTFASWALQGRGVFSEPIPDHVVMRLGGWESREAFARYGRFSAESLEQFF